MTSKELLDLLYRELSLCLNNALGFLDGDDVFVSDDGKEAYKQLSEDLEVLEVLKKNIDLHAIINTLNDEEDAEKLIAFLNRDE